VRHVLARHEQGAGHMAEGYARGFRTCGSGDRDLGPRRDEPRDPDRRRVDGLDPRSSASRARCARTSSAPTRSRSATSLASRSRSSSTRGSCRTSRTSRVSSRPRSTSRGPGRCGPVLVDVPRDVQETMLDFEYPDSVDLPGWKPPQKGHPRQIARAAEALAAAEKPVLYVGRRHAQRGRVRGAACPRGGRALPGR
jgi:acetolactate synthase-1/2/3 large subunit